MPSTLANVDGWPAADAGKQPTAPDEDADGAQACVGVLVGLLESNSAVQSYGLSHDGEVMNHSIDGDQHRARCKHWGTCGRSAWRLNCDYNGRNV